MITFIAFLVAGFILWYFFRAKDITKTDNRQSVFLVNNFEEKFHPLKYSPKRLMTRHEEYFFKQLEHLIADKYYIFPQVHLNKIMKVDQNVPGKTSEWRGLYGRIDRRSIDFIIFSKSDVKPIVAIELDDWTHKFGSRVIRDRFVDDCMKAVGLPILHIYNSTLSITDSNKIIETLHSVIS